MTAPARFLAGILCLFLAGCGRAGDANPKTVDSPRVAVEHADDTNIVEVDHPEQFPLWSVEARPVTDQLQVNGTVVADVSRTVPVVSLSGGRVVEVKARLGDQVQKGKTLLILASSDLATAFADYDKFQASEQLAERQLERSQRLYAGEALARKDLDAAEDAARKAKVDVATAAERIRILGADLAHPSPLIQVRAPVSGTIVEQNTTGGAGVKSLDNSPNLFTVADLSRVWVLCDVYENNLRQVRLGDFAEVRLNAYPDRPLNGRVGNISNVLDPGTRTAKVRLELNNPSGLLRPGMFATVRFVSQGAQRRLVAPASAILRLHDKDWVFLAEGERRFRRLEVQAGPTLPDGFQPVTGGLKPGDKIVANALQFSTAVAM